MYSMCHRNLQIICIKCNKLYSGQRRILRQHNRSNIAIGVYIMACKYNDNRHGLNINERMCLQSRIWLERLSVCKLCRRNV